MCLNSLCQYKVNSLLGTGKEITSFSRHLAVDAINDYYIYANKITIPLGKYLSFADLRLVEHINGSYDNILLKHTVSFSFL